MPQEIQLSRLQNLFVWLSFWHMGIISHRIGAKNMGDESAETHRPLALAASSATHGTPPVVGLAAIANALYVVRVQVWMKGLEKEK